MIGPNMSTSQPRSIGDALFGRTRQRVLSLLFGRPDSRFFVNEILRDAKTGRGSVQRELENLVAAGLIEARVEGRQRYFQASRESPVFAEIEALVRKTFGVTQVLQTALVPLAARIEFAAVYGSIARGTANARSDIDVLVIGEVDYLALAGALVEPEQALGRSINPTVFSRHEWQKRLEDGSSFARDLMSHPMLVLIGDVDELGKPRKDRQPARAARGLAGNRKAARSGSAKPRGRRAHATGK